MHHGAEGGRTTERKANCGMADDANAFCQTCQYAYESWSIHVHLFRDFRKFVDVEDEAFISSGLGMCVYHLNRVTHHDFISQVAKLHDPSKTANHENLSIERFREHEDWTKEELKILDKIVPVLNDFYRRIKPARDKILAHNDYETSIEDRSLGGFPEGQDEDYFCKLEEFANMVWDKWAKGVRLSNRRVRFGRSPYRFSLRPPDESAGWAPNQAIELRSLIVEGITKRMPHLALDPFSREP